ncbi:MAG: response regulator [Bacteroidota bacterium]
MQYQNIVLIDDDAEDHEIFGTALSLVSKQLNFSSFTNAKVALDKLDANEIDPDIIFLDLNMPVMSGEEFLTRIKKIDHLKHIPVIIFSTTSNPSTIAGTKQLGAIDFITKPNRFDTLVDILKPIIN